MYSSEHSSMKNYLNINQGEWHQIDDVLTRVYRVWARLELHEKRQTIKEVKAIFSSSNEFNSDSGTYQMNSVIPSKRSLASSNNHSIRSLNENQNQLAGMICELSFDELKRRQNFENLKFYFWIPEYWKSDKMKVATKITKAQGMIKTNLKDVDYIIVNESLVNADTDDCKREQCKLYNYMMYKKNQEKEIAKNSKITENIKSLQSGAFKSRIMKLVSNELTNDEAMPLKSIKTEERKADYEFTNLFDFLWNNKWKAITMNDLNDVLCRQESIETSNEFYKKRLKGTFEDPYKINFKSMFLITSFRSNGLNKAHTVAEYQSSYHKFDLKIKRDIKDDYRLEYMRNFNPFLYSFHMQKYEVPMLSISAPKGTSVFQTNDEYDFGIKSRSKLEFKYQQSIKELYNKIGGIGKDVEHEHPEQKPADKHWFWFLCKIEFNDYFDHVFSDSHRNSLWLQSKSYNEIDELCDQLFDNLKVDYQSFSWIPTRESTFDGPAQPMQIQTTKMTSSLDNLIPVDQNLKEIIISSSNEEVLEENQSNSALLQDSNINDGENPKSFGVDVQESSNAYSNALENEFIAPWNISEKDISVSINSKAHVTPNKNQARDEPISASKSIIKEWDQQDDIDQDMQAALNIGKNHKINAKVEGEFSSDSDGKMGISFNLENIEKENINLDQQINNMNEQFIGTKGKPFYDFLIHVSKIFQIS